MGAAMATGLEREDTGVDEPAQPVGQDIACHAETALEIAEAAHAIERVAHDKQRPAVADESGGAGDGAGFGWHRHMVAF
jgi:hypothetical protein